MMDAYNHHGHPAETNNTLISVEINCEALEQIINDQPLGESTNLLRIHWKRDGVARNISLRIGVSYKTTDVNTTQAAQLEVVKRIVHDISTIKSIAKTMCKEFNLQLTAIDVFPLTLSFDHCSGTRSESLLNRKDALALLMKRFLFNERASNQEFQRWQLTIKTMRIGDVDAKRMSDADKQSGTFIVQKHGSIIHSPSTNERFLSIEEMLRSQKYAMLNHLDQDHNILEDIKTQMSKIGVQLKSTTHLAVVNGTSDKAAKIQDEMREIGAQELDKSVDRLENRGQTDSRESRERQAQKTQGSHILTEKNHLNVIGIGAIDHKKSGDVMRSNPCVKDGVNDDMALTDSQYQSGCDLGTPSIDTDVSAADVSMRANHRRWDHNPKTLSSTNAGSTDDMPLVNNPNEILQNCEDLSSDDITLTDEEEYFSDDMEELDDSDDLYATHAGEVSPYEGYRYERTAYPGYAASTSSATACSYFFKMMFFVSGNSPGNQNLKQLTTNPQFVSALGTTMAGMMPKTTSRSSPLTYLDSLKPIPLNFNLEEKDQLYINIGPTQQRKKIGLMADTERKARLGLLAESITGNMAPGLLAESMTGNMAPGLLAESITGNMAPGNTLEDRPVDDEPADILRAENGMDTVICVDTSESVKDIVKVKQMLHSFIDGLESIADMYGIEENIALVSFQENGKILHHLTNDYESLRASIDELQVGIAGSLLGGLSMAFSCLSRGGLYQIDTNVKLPPRIIIIADGSHVGGHSHTSARSNVADLEVTSLVELRPRQIDDGVPSPVIFVPLGPSICTTCQETLSTSTGMQLCKPEYFQQLHKYQRHQIISSMALRHIRERKFDESIFQQEFSELLRTLGFEMTNIDKNSILEKVFANYPKMTPSVMSTNSFYNIREDADLPPLGSRVMRGHDWQWDNQDTDGPGTIFNHCDDKLVSVCWDSGVSNVYRYGQDGQFDVVVVHDQPRMNMDGSADIGVQVQRGPDWHYLYQDQDGGKGQHGVIIRHKKKLGRVMVRWKNGHIYDYECGRQLEVLVRDPAMCLLEATANEEEIVKDTEDKKGAVKDSAYNGDEVETHRDNEDIPKDIDEEESAKYRCHREDDVKGNIHKKGALKAKGGMEETLKAKGDKEDNMTAKGDKQCTVIAKGEKGEKVSEDEKMAVRYETDTSKNSEEEQSRSNCNKSQRVKDTNIKGDSIEATGNKKGAIKPTGNSKERVESRGGESVHEPVWEWQRQDSSGGWVTYSQDDRVKLSRAYRQRAGGSCLLRRGRQSFRVSFKSMEERGINVKMKTPVRMNLQSL